MELDAALPDFGGRNGAPEACDGMPESRSVSTRELLLLPAALLQHALGHLVDRAVSVAGPGGVVASGTQVDTSRPSRSDDIAILALRRA